MQESKPEPRGMRRRKRLRMFLIGLSSILVGYALSMGPAYRLLRKDWLHQQTFSSAYSPILHLSDHSRPFFRVMDWYLTVWYSDERELIGWLQELKAKNE